MRKLEIPDAEIMRLVVQQEIARSEDSRHDHRLQGILLASKVWAATKWPSGWGRIFALSSAGCTASKGAALPDCKKASARILRPGLARRTRRRWRVTFHGTPAAGATRKPQDTDPLVLHAAKCLAVHEVSRRIQRQSAAEPPPGSERVAIATSTLWLRSALTRRVRTSGGVLEGKALRSHNGDF